MTKKVQVRSHSRDHRGRSIQVKRHSRSVEGPHSTVTRPIPKRKDVVWEYGLHAHRALRAGSHLDLRLGDERGHVHSWAIRRFPERGKSSFAFQTFTHERPYMDFEGRLKGYGAGDVSLADRGLALVHSSNDNKVVYSVVKGRQSEDYALVRVHGKTWVIHHTTPESVPSGKPKYREIAWDPASISDDPSVVVGPKIDGAHGIIELRKGKRPRVYSAATTKTGERIEYTHKIPGLFSARWDGEDALLRGEIAAADKRGRPKHFSVTSGLLNANLLTSISEQRRKGTPLRVFLFDASKVGGKDVGALPYTERFKLLQKLSSKNPAFVVVPAATSAKEKKTLLSAIQRRKHPLTSEGVVVWDGEGPAKMKTRKEFDVFIREIYKSLGSGPYSKAAGGFRYSFTPEGKIVGKVGTGLRLGERKRMLLSPEDYIGHVARVGAQEQLKSGALRAPSFQGLHLEKNASSVDDGLEKTAGPILQLLIARFLVRKESSRRRRGPA